MKKILFFAILPMLFLASCQEDITLDLPPYEPKLAVFCILQSDTVPVLYLNRSKSYFNYGDTTHNDGFVKDAQVVITDVTENKADTLKGDSGIMVNPYANSNYQMNAFYYKGKLAIKPSHNYILYISEGGKTLKSETTVPAKINISSVTYQKDSSSWYGGVKLYSKFTDEAGRSNAYAVYVGHIFYDIDPITGEKRERVDYLRQTDFIYDNNSDGQEMEAEAFDYDNGADTFSVSLRLENLSIEAARYLDAIYKQQDGNGDPFSEPVILPHNIEGGLGIFGSATESAPVRVKIQ